jgi:hypothetical protein
MQVMKAKGGLDEGEYEHRELLRCERTRAVARGRLGEDRGTRD